MYFIADGPMNGGLISGAGGGRGYNRKFTVSQSGHFFSNFLDFSQLNVDSSENKTAKG